jgi:hypothetical protein
MQLGINGYYSVNRNDRFPFVDFPFASLIPALAREKLHIRLYKLPAFIFAR